MRLVPASISSDTPSPGEREIFRRLLQANPEATLGWTVLHSLDIAKHVRQVRGEADFVFIIPYSGVLVLEVKAHKRVSRDPTNGLWYLGQDTPTPRSPFRQACDAMYSIRKAVLNTDPSLKDVIFCHAVVFPYVGFKVSSTEWNSWEVIDRHSMSRYPIEYLAAAVLIETRRFLKEVQKWYHLEGQKMPTPGDCQRIVEILRPSFEFCESPRARLQSLQSELKQYTEEQYGALDSMEANPRIVFQGPAGTGKTLLALEAARRASARGDKVLLLCFNHLLGDWIHAEAGGLPGVTATTLHRFLLRLSGKPVPIGADPQYWQADLPSAAIDALLEQDGEIAMFDRLVIDEAQDILHVPYLDVLDLCLRGGLSSGYWTIFGDFTHQNIYQVGTVTVGELAEQRSNATTYLLRDNCRNTPRIAAFAHAYGGFEPNYRRIRRSDDTINPQTHLYEGIANRETSLVSSVQYLLDEGFTNDEIVVLSTLGDAQCAVSSVVDQRWRNRFRGFRDYKPGYIRYGSVHAFKGMEAGAVVVTDVPGRNTDKLRELLYIAATRALHRLTVLIDRQRRTEFLAVVGPQVTKESNG